jgi:hypothetical protein
MEKHLREAARHLRLSPKSTVRHETVCLLVHISSTNPMKIRHSEPKYKNLYVLNMMALKQKGMPLFLRMDLEGNSCELHCHLCLVLPGIAVVQSIARGFIISPVTFHLGVQVASCLYQHCLGFYLKCSQVTRVDTKSH